MTKNGLGRGEERYKKLTTIKNIGSATERDYKDTGVCIKKNGRKNRIINKMIS